MNESPIKERIQETASTKKFIPILIILLLSFAVYFNALFGDFVYDDKPQIVQNPWIRDVIYLPDIFTNSSWGFKSSASNYYRPLQLIVYMANYLVFGLKPWGFHLVNILFHCGASVLVFLIIRRFLGVQNITKSSVYISPPFIAALLFGVHPIHTEAVTWISGLPDVSFTFLYLLSFYLYMLYRDGVKRAYLLSILSYSAATLFKEPALTLPIMLIAYDHLFKKSNRIISAGFKIYIPYLVISCVYLMVRYYAIRGFARSEFYTELSTQKSIINIFPLFKEYIAYMLWPFNLNLWHTFHPISSISEANGMISVAVIVIFLIGMLASYKKNKLIFFALLIFVIPLLPVFYIKGIVGKPFAERYLYLPSVGFVLLMAVFLAWLRERLPRAERSITISVMIVVGLFSIVTVNRNTVWKDSYSLWSDTVRKSPDSSRAHNDYGVECANRGQLDLAIAEFQTALRLEPEYPGGHFNLGNAYAYKELLDEAIAEFQTALRLEPYHLGARYNLAITYLKKGNIDAAQREVELLLKIKPDYYNAQQLLNDIISKRH